MTLIKPGDVVTHKAGGKELVVISSEGEEYLCRYFDPTTNDYKQVYFNKVELEKSEEPRPIISIE